MAALFVFVLIVILAVSLTHRSKMKEITNIAASYIKTMEAKDVSVIEEEIFNARWQTQLAEIKENLAEDPDAVWRNLKELGTVFMGDSRVVGFDVFGYFDESRVLASAGATIRLIPDSLDTLSVINPKIVLLGYGINDMNNTWYWESLDEYIEELNEHLKTLTELLPNAYIYVNSIIPVNEHGLETSYTWAAIPDWNEAIKKNCIEKGYRYLDISDLVAEHADLYAEDGIHIQSAFYPYWAEALLTQYLSDVQGY